YKKDDGLTVHPIGNFINPGHVLAKHRNPRMVTFINPAFAKGAAVVARILMMANKERPDIPFMVVETRKKFAKALETLKQPGGPIGSAFGKHTFQNIFLTPATYEVSEIYAQTKVLLAPSLWYESWGRVCTEAVMNGIPVLASTSGGMPEAVGKGGITLDAPATNRQGNESWLVLPSEEECRPWADALYELYDHADDWKDRCAEAAQTNGIQARGDALLKLLEPFLSRRAGDADFSRRGSVRYEGDPLDWEIGIRGRGF
ncbi:glycosyltransferase, partial [Sutterella sp.]|uniref:glycosyltransferase n=1 Tax=Sutterella sp. TaxID=1981025 RepID=UPI0026E04DA1